VLLAVQFVVLPVAMATFGTHHSAGSTTTPPPAGADRVSFSTRDGVELVAWYTPSRNGAVVLLLHGAGGTKGDTLPHAAVLTGHGYGVLALDARGSGESGGHGMLWGWHGDTDIEAALAWLGARPDVDPARIGVVGLSMGGEQAITAAASDDRIRAVVAEGASARIPADAAAIRPSGLQGAIQSLYYPIMWGVADAMSEADPPMPLDDAVRSLGDRRLLLISSDDPIDHAAGPVLQRAAMASVELWEPPHTGHTQAVAVHPDEWRARVLEFLDRELRMP
jgi:alpha-beta hydrolase superfamily lysophospholipase